VSLPRFLVAANWKMHLLQADAAAWCRVLRAGLPDTGRNRDLGIVVFPSFPLLPLVARELAGSGVGVGGQDLHPEDNGAHTGDVSGAQLADAGCTWVLCGHSERRRDHGESDELVGRKVAAAVRHGLAPLVCVGETREERRAGDTFAVLERQLRDMAGPLGGAAGFAIAYEPVWAIGTGRTATPAQAQAVHAFIRSKFTGLDGTISSSLRILYGGSVKAANAAELFAQADVDGGLIGGASLIADDFLAICAAAQR
jgi:triosephosphate isomerase